MMGRRLSGVELIDLRQSVLARAWEPWPTPIRTLDALHLTTAHYLRRQGEAVDVARYDSGPIAAARALNLPIAAL